MERAPEEDPSTGPTIGLPSAVAVASASRHIPWSRSATCSAVSRRSGVMIRRRCVPGCLVAAVEQVLQRGEVGRRLVHCPEAIRRSGR